MPTYEFWCPKCRTEFEVQRPIAEYDKPAFCPNCKSEGERLVSPFGAKVGYKFQAARKAFRQRPEKQQ